MYFFVVQSKKVGLEIPQRCGPRPPAIPFVHIIYFLIVSTGLVQLYIASIHSDPARLLGHLLCRGPSLCPIVVSGNSGFRTHVLVVSGGYNVDVLPLLYLDPLKDTNIIL